MSEFLRDGYQTLVTFANYATVMFRIIRVTPPPLVGGGAIPQSTMENTAWHTDAPKALKRLGPSSMTVAYDPEAYASGEIPDMLNENQLITYEFPDGDTLQFWGWLDEFTPGEHVEGERPEAEITIIPSLLNGSWAETAPAHST